MKILQFAYSFCQGGCERFVVDLTNELAKYNQTVLYGLRDDTIGNDGFYVPDISNKVTYINLKISPGFKLQLIWSFYRILRKEKPDIVHCHLNLVNYFFLLSLFFHKKIRFLYTIHNSAKTEVKFEMERLVRRFFFKRRFFIPVAISDETKHSYQNYYKLNAIKVVYNGRKFTGRSINYEAVVNEIAAFKFTKDTLVFCHLARYFERSKNHKMLVAVFNRLRNEGYDLILLILGDGYEDAFELKEMAGNNIHFLGLKSNVNDYLYASDAFCLSSNFEGMPISLIEAFACGCTPICTPVGGCINTIKHGVTGFLSKTVFEEDYLYAVKQFIDHRIAVDKSKLISFYHENFSIEMCASKYIKLYVDK